MPSEATRLFFHDNQNNLEKSLLAEAVLQASSSFLITGTAARFLSLIAKGLHFRDSISL